MNKQERQTEPPEQTKAAKEKAPYERPRVQSEPLFESAAAAQSTDKEDNPFVCTS